MAGTILPERAFRWIQWCIFSKRVSSPKRFEEDFPHLKRSQIYGVIAFYLDHEGEVDKYLEDTLHQFEGRGVPMTVAKPALWEKIRRSRTHVGEPRLAAGNASPGLLIVAQWADCRCS